MIDDEHNKIKIRDKIIFKLEEIFNNKNENK
jgi:hypothetical protein